jgi:hypothetical protein
MATREVSGKQILIIADLTIPRFLVALWVKKRGRRYEPEHQPQLSHDLRQTPSLFRLMELLDRNSEAEISD